jgi:hypothetical protein
MAYLYEDKELVYEKQMVSLKRRIVLVNTTIFLINFLVIFILLFNRMDIMDFITLVVPVFLLNLVISYAMLINRDSNEQLYLAMYTSIIGTIVVIINIFLIEQNPATYMLIYLAIAIISVYKDKKAVSLGYIIIFLFGTIIHFNHTSAIVGINSINNNLTPYLYESLLVIVLLVQTARTIYNEKEIDDLYEQLETQKEVELKYQLTIYNLLNNKQELENYTDQYLNDDTTERLKKYVSLFNENFYIKEDLLEKLERYLSLQRYKNPSKILGNRLGGYQVKKELSFFDEMSTYKASKMMSLLMTITYKNQKNSNTNSIKNFESIFMNPDMSIEVQIIGFIMLYEHLRNEKPYISNLSHEDIVEYFNKHEIYENIDKEIIDFFIHNEQTFKSIYENEIKEKEQENVDETR